MAKLAPLARALGASALGLLLAAPPALALDGTEIMDKMDKTNRSKDEVIDSTMLIISASGQRRVRKLRTYTKAGAGDDDMILIRFVAPADMKGTGLLTVEEGSADSQLLFLPDLRKSRRIAGATKANSFVGSDFSNYDMRTEDLQNHAYSLLGDETIGDRDCYKVEAKPKDADTEEATGYSKRTFWIDKERFVPYKVDCYDRNGKLLKVLVLTEYTQIKGLWRAGRAQCKNVQEGSQTVIANSAERQINDGLDDSIFTKRNLEKP